MTIEDLVTGSTGSAAPTASPGSDGGGLHSGADDFWKSNGSFIEQIARRAGVRETQTPQAHQDPEFQEYLRWKAAKEGKDPRSVLELAGMQPRDALDAMLFGTSQPKEEPKVDPIEQIRSDLNELKSSIQEERQQRQSVQEKIEESRAKASFADKVRAMEDLELVKRWGSEAIDTAWNLFVSDCEAALKAKQNGQQVSVPTLRSAAIKVENYLRRQANAVGDVFGAARRLDELVDAPDVPRVAADAGTEPKPAIGPTLTNATGHSGAGGDRSDLSPAALRKRALEAAAKLRG